MTGALHVGLVGRIGAPLSLRTFFERRNARDEQEEDGNRDRSNDSGPLPAAVVACCEHEDAPPAQQLAEVVRMPAVLPETGIHPARRTTLSSLRDELLRIGDGLDRQMVHPKVIHFVHGPGALNHIVAGNMMSQTAIPCPNQNLKNGQNRSRTPSNRASRPI